MAVLDGDEVGDGEGAPSFAVDVVVGEGGDGALLGGCGRWVFGDVAQGDEVLGERATRTADGAVGFAVGEVEHAVVKGIAEMDEEPGAFECGGFVEVRKVSPEMKR